MMHLLDLIVSPNSSLQTALERMTKNRKGLLFVCDDAHLVGVISDGDIRRALVSQALLIARVETYMNLDPIIAGSTEEGKQLLKNHNLLAVPVLDGEGMVIGAIVQGINQIEILNRKTEEAFVAVDDQGSGTIAIITARGGSKRIPRKNLALVAGRPLLAYAIEAAKGADSISRIIVSTDDREIADVALKFGAEVPWLRPSFMRSSGRVVNMGARLSMAYYSNRLRRFARLSRSIRLLKY
jgi:CBS domain-containing protein